MSATEETDKPRLPQEKEALIEALHRKINYQGERIDELEDTVEHLTEQLSEVKDEH